MTLRGSDKLKAINTATLCMACTQRPGKSPNQRRQLRAAKIIVVVKAQGGKLKDQLRLESGRTEGKKKILALPSEFPSVQITSRKV